MGRLSLGVLAFACAGPVVAEPVFEDRSAALAAHSYVGGWEHFVGGGVAVFDCNSDGLPDILAAGGEAPVSLFINRDGFAFDHHVLPLTGVTGAYPLDMTADGVLDVFVLRVGQNRVLRGRGDCRFDDITPKVGLPDDAGWSTAFSAWWAPGVDRPTLAVGNYVDRADPNGPFGTCDDNQILRPQGLLTYAAQPLTPGYCPLSMLAARDARGRMTLRISNDRHYYVSDGREQMWDIADQRYLDDGDGWLGPRLWGMGIASRDLTGDGRDEVMLTSMGDQLLQLAQPDGSYAPAPFSQGTYAQRPHTGGDGRPSTGWHAEFGDIDNDGRADLFIAKGNVDQMPGMAMDDPNNLLMQGADGRFEEKAAQAGVATLVRSRGAALADFDADGRLDLVVVNRRAPMELYRNVTQDVGDWLRIDLVQPGGNRRAVGALVTVTHGEQRQSQQVVVGGGHAGGQALPLHFGLGSATTAQVRVDWPEGGKSELSVQDVNTVVVIERP